MANLILEIIGLTILFYSTEIGRGEESKIKFFSGKWWLRIALITIGVTLFDII
jgi:hypothetical protein